MSTTPKLAEPVVVAVEMPATGTRSVQFWARTDHPGRKSDHWEDVVTIDAPNNAVPALHIKRDCPEEWLATAWGAYLLVRAGGLPEATHSIAWGRDADGYTAPTFTEVAR